MTKEVEIRLLEMMGRKNIRTIQELHKASGISRTIISDLLNGNKRSIRLDTVEKLCKALDCEIGELIQIKRGVING
jgi:putative transcriptional regulator